MTALSRALLFLKRHVLVIVELAALVVCGLVVRFWFPGPPLAQLVPSLVLLAFLFPPPRPGAAYSWMTFLRVPVAAGINYALFHFIVDDTLALRLTLGSWSALAGAASFAFLGRQLWSSRLRLSLGRLPAGWRRLGSPMVNVVLPIALAWGGAVALHHTIYPPETRGPSPHKNSYGPVHLSIRLSDARAGIPEPLVVSGKAGRASLVFIRLLGENRAKIGIEFWGFDLNQGAEFTLPPEGSDIDVVCEMPALFPAKDDSSWDDASSAIRHERSRRFRVTVNGIVRLEGESNYELPRRPPLYFGANPLGGSFISSRFSGTVVQATQGGAE